MDPPRYLARAACGTAFAVLATAVAVRAQAPINEGASVLIFPKVIADASRETTIQLTTLNVLESTICTYLDPDAVTETTFTPLQYGGSSRTTHWLVSTGRSGNPGVGELELVPPAPAGFHGALACIEVDPTGAPVLANGLFGHAILTNIAGRDISSYDGIAFQGVVFGDGDDRLCLGGIPDATCPDGAEYGGCPETWILQHPSEGVQDVLLGFGSSVETTVTLMPCTLDLDTLSAEPVVIRVEVVNEFEGLFSMETVLTRWADISLGAFPAFARSVVGSDTVQSFWSPDATSGGFVMVAEEFHKPAFAGGATSSAVAQPAHRGLRTRADVLTLPPLVVRP